MSHNMLHFGRKYHILRIMNTNQNLTKTHFGGAGRLLCPDIMYTCKIESSGAPGDRIRGVGGYFVEKYCFIFWNPVNYQNV